MHLAFNFKANKHSLKKNENLYAWTKVLTCTFKHVFIQYDLTGSLVSWVLMLTWAGLTALSWPHAGVCGQMMGFLGLTGLDQICWDYPTHPPINKPRLLVMIVAGVQKKKWRWAISFPYFCYVEFAISSLTYPVWQLSLVRNHLDSFTLRASERLI